MSKMENTKTNLIPEGKIIVFKYTNHRTLAVVRALRDIDVKSVESLYFGAHTSQRHPMVFRSKAMLKWLIENEYVEKIDYCSLLFYEDMTSRNMCLHSFSEVSGD